MLSGETGNLRLSTMDVWGRPSRSLADRNMRYTMEAMLKLRPHLEALVFRVSEDGGRSAGFDRVKALGNEFISAMTLLQLYKELPEVECTILESAHNVLCDVSTLADTAEKLGFPGRMTYPAGTIITAAMLRESLAAYVGALWEQNGQLVSVVEAFCEQALREKIVSVVRSAKKGEIGAAAKSNGTRINGLHDARPTAAAKVNGGTRTAKMGSTDGGRTLNQGSATATTNGIRLDKAGPLTTPIAKNFDGSKTAHVNLSATTIVSINPKTTVVEDLTLEDDETSDDAVILTVTAVENTTDLSPAQALRTSNSAKMAAEGVTTSQVRSSNVLRKSGDESHLRPVQKLSYVRPTEKVQNAPPNLAPSRPTTLVGNGTAPGSTAKESTISPVCTTEEDPKKPRGDSSSVASAGGMPSDGKKRKIGDQDSSAGRPMKRQKGIVKGRAQVIEGFKLELDNFIRMKCPAADVRYDLTGLEPTGAGYSEYSTAVRVGAPGLEISVQGTGTDREKSEQDAARLALEKMKERYEDEEAGA